MTTSTILNPENKCCQLYQEDLYDQLPGDKLQQIFEMQHNLQLRYGKDPNKMTFKERVDQLTVQWRNLSTEFTELLERLPFKEWKTYSPEQLAGFLGEEHMRECQFEFIDMMHFMVNFAVYLGIDHRTAFNLYASKNAENFARQNRGY